MQNRMRYVSIVVIIVMLAFSPRMAGARTLQLADVRTIAIPSSPQISPDGERIAFVLSRPEYGSNEYQTQLIVMDIATRALSVKTRSLKDVANPHWSPNADRVAFLARAASGDEAGSQVFALLLRDGLVRQVTHAPNGVDTFAWRPDGRAIAYDTADSPRNQSAIARHHDAFEVGNDGGLLTAAPTPVNLWLAAADGSASRPITSGGGMVFGGDAGTLLSWAPDGKTVALTWAPTPHLGDTNAAKTMIVDMRSGAMHALTAHRGFENYATYSPDGTKIAYWYPRDGDGLNGQEIYVTSARGAEGKDVTRALDRDMSGVAWLPGGSALLVSGPDSTSVGLWVQPLDGPARRLDLGVVDPAWDNSTDMGVGKNGAIVFAGSEPARPQEIYYLKSVHAAPERLTDFNATIAALELGRSKTIHWRNDGFDEDGVLTYPPHFQPGRKYPLLLRLHGGPNYQSSRTFWDFIQLAAARGYLVFQPNYRGSDNLGSAYEHAIFNDGVRGPSRDIMAGVRAVERLGIVDTSREAVSGHSYGGYLTAWLTATTGPGRWKAAVLYAAELDPLVQYYLEDYNVAEWYYFKDRPWRSRSVMQSYIDQSALTHVGGVRTPTLILSNTGDGRVPTAPEFAWFQALRDTAVPVKFVLFPGAGHDISGPVHVEDEYRLWFGWVDKYLR
ncbi:MAG: S9 family peptidase [Candidatus Eremiobacteraeota bacterium]|nr:S9 family peptidase [Candidatus Eremiobacteraeota bacterium]